LGGGSGRKVTVNIKTGGGRGSAIMRTEENNKSGASYALGGRIKTGARGGGFLPIRNKQDKRTKSLDVL